MNTLIDVRHVLPTIRVPTLVMHRVNDQDANIEEGRYLAARIPGAKFIELPGSDHVIYAGDQESVLAPVESFLKDLERPRELDTVLATALWVGPAGESSPRLRAIASREAVWFKGRIAAGEENGFLAIFDGPARAIRCACAVARGAAQAGIPVRAALHTGLCEINGDRISGAAPETSRRLAASTAVGDIVVSSSTHDLVSGSGITFRKQDQSQHEEISGVAQLFTVNC
jgi:hypothetical protein